QQEADHELHVLLSDEVVDETPELGQYAAPVGGAAAGHEVGLVVVVAPLDQGEARLPARHQGVDPGAVVELGQKRGQEVRLQEHRVVVQKKDQLAARAGQA